MNVRFSAAAAYRALSARGAKVRLVSACAIVAAAGCGGGHGFLGTDYNPKGGIVVSDAAAGTVLTTSAATPYHVTGGGFSVGFTETNFHGPYSVAVTGWNNSRSVPCFVPHSVTPTGGTSVELFSADNALLPGAAGPNPCIGGGVDVESAVISDGKGNSTTFFYTLE